jgi:RNA polymerase sigma factor (sigma-70 family)
MHIFRKNNTQQIAHTDIDMTNAFDKVSDEALMQAIASGAVWAMEILYERYHRALYSVIYRMVSDQQVAEDLLQESFLAVWRRAVSYLPQQGEVRSWLFSIVHHRAIDHLRSLQRRVALHKISLDDVEQDEQMASPDAWDETWLSVQRTCVREAIIALPKEQRLVIELAYFQGWTQSEIAEGCHIPLGTVKARIRLGLIHLKRILENQGFNEN